jgi:hypothetical protein
LRGIIVVVVVVLAADEVDRRVVSTKARVVHFKVTEHVWEW